MYKHYLAQKNQIIENLYEKQKCLKEYWVKQEKTEIQLFSQLAK